MNSGSCNGQSKDASDCSGGTLNISHRARQGKRVKERARERGGEICSMHGVIFSSDGLTGSAARK